jgi:hypothetical protein
MPQPYIRCVSSRPQHFNPSHICLLCPRFATENGATQTISTRCYLRMPSNANANLSKRIVNLLSKSTLAPKTQIRGRSRLARRPSRLPLSSGLSKQIRYVRFSLPSPMLIHVNITANSNVQQCRVQENARHCISSKLQHSTSLGQAVKGTDSHNVQLQLCSLRDHLNVPLLSLFSVIGFTDILFFTY